MSTLDLDPMVLTAAGATVVREAVCADVEELVELGSLMHRESPAWFRFDYVPARVRLFLHAVIADELGVIFVGERDEQIVGGIVGNAGPHWSSNDLIAHEHALYLLPAYRGGALAVRLVKRLEQWAFYKGVKALHVGTTTGVADEMVAGFYERLGFKRSAIGLEKFYGD